MQIKTTIQTTSHRSEWPTLKSLQITNSGEGVEKREPPYNIGGYVNWCSHYRKQLWRFLKKLKIELPYDPEFHSWAYTQTKL